MVFIFGIASAVFYGLASVMQQRVAAAAPREHALRLGLLSHLVRRPLWTAGIAADVVAFVLHATALGYGPLTLVQPLLTTGLLFAILLSALWDRRWLSGMEWLGCLAMMAGLALLLSVSSPTEGRAVVAFHRWIIAGGLVAAGSAVLIAWSRRASLRVRPALLAVAAALTFAATDALVKSMVDVLHSGGIVEVIDGWYLYGLIVMGLIGTVLVQSAFQAGPLASSLPALTAVEPVASGAIGVILFAEHLRADPFALSVEAVAALMVLYGIWVLGRSPAVTGDTHHAPPGQPGAFEPVATQAQSLPGRNLGDTVR